MKDRFKSFTLLIKNISRSIKKIKTEEMKSYNLKSPHVSCLYYLYKEGPLTTKELVDICEEDKASVSRTIDYLEAENYILTETGGRKKYKCLLKLTEKGKEVGKRLSNKIDNILDQVSIGLSEENREIMYQCLGKVSENLKTVTEEVNN